MSCKYEKTDKFTKKTGQYEKTDKFTEKTGHKKNQFLRPLAVAYRGQKSYSKRLDNLSFENKLNDGSDRIYLNSLLHRTFSRFFLPFFVTDILVTDRKTIRLLAWSACAILRSDSRFESFLAATNSIRSALTNG